MHGMLQSLLQEVQLAAILQLSRTVDIHNKIENRTDSKGIKWSMTIIQVRIMHTSKNVSLAEPQKLALSLLILHTNKQGKATRNTISISCTNNGGKGALNFEVCSIWQSN